MSFVIKIVCFAKLLSLSLFSRRWKNVYHFLLYRSIHSNSLVLTRRRERCTLCTNRPIYKQRGLLGGWSIPRYPSLVSPSCAETQSTPRSHHHQQKGIDETAKNLECCPKIFRGIFRGKTSGFSGTEPFSGSTREFWINIFNRDVGFELWESGIGHTLSLILADLTENKMIDIKINYELYVGKNKMKKISKTKRSERKIVRGPNKG